MTQMEETVENNQDDVIKYYTLSEVEERNTFKSTWIILENKVYDVTTFLEENDREKIAKPSESIVTTIREEPSWWANWLIPALTAAVVTLMYRLYTTEDQLTTTEDQ